MGEYLSSLARAAARDHLELVENVTLQCLASLLIRRLSRSQHPAIIALSSRKDGLSDMSLSAFLVQVGIVSLSGVMAPGPMTAVTMGHGTKSPHAGLLIALGHGIVEIPLMVAIMYGFGYLLEITRVQDIIALAGGVVLLFMGMTMFQGMRRQTTTATRDPRSPLKAGILLSAGNPYFIVWWATIGATLVIQSAQFGTAGFVAFAGLHWLCDFIWCYCLSIMSFKGGQFFGQWFQKAVFGLCGAFLFFFSGRFIWGAVRSLCS